MRAEIGRYRGLLTARLQIDGVALLGIALGSRDPAEAAAELRALAECGRREGRLAHLYAVRFARALADLADALGGTPLPRSARQLLETAAQHEGGMLEVLLLRALQRGYQASGDAAAAMEIAARLPHAPDLFDRGSAGSDRELPTRAEPSARSADQTHEQVRSLDRTASR